MWDSPGWRLADELRISLSCGATMESAVGFTCNVLTRKTGYLTLQRSDVPAASQQLERQGYAVLRGVLRAAEIAALSAEINDLAPGELILVRHTQQAERKEKGRKHTGEAGNV